MFSKIHLYGYNWKQKKSTILYNDGPIPIENSFYYTSSI